MTRGILTIAWFLGFMGGCRKPVEPAAPVLIPVDPDPDGAALGVNDAELRTLLLEHWQTRVMGDPTLRRRLGVHGAALPTAGAAGLDTTSDNELARRAAAIDPWHLDERDRVSLEVLRFELRAQDRLTDCQGLNAETRLDSGKNPGLTHFDGGDDCYEALIEAHTTLRMRPSEVHERGVASLAVAERAMAQLVEGGTPLPGDSGNVLHGGEIVGAMVTSIARFREKAGLAFEAPRWDKLRIHTASPGGFWGRYYSASDTALGRIIVGNEMPAAFAPVLAFHEATPGHHWTVLYEQQAEARPALRRYAWFLAAFEEGWAVYSEALAHDLDLYETDEALMGLHAFEAWRAARLVVDTGIHHYGWTRGQAESFLAEHTVLDHATIRAEVNQHIREPGRLLVYQVGGDHIAQLRDYARATLGEAFDLPSFHAVIQGQGPVPLATLTRRVHDWVEGQTRVE